jgi:hypothetical protein
MATDARRGQLAAALPLRQNVLTQLSGQASATDTMSVF